MKFLHTADWQLGMKAVHVGEAGNQVRETRMAALRHAIEIARENAVDFVLVAGDAFEDNGVETFLVQSVADLLARVGRPVYLIPGNHDPLVPGSVWEHPAWKSAENVHILREEHPVEIPGGVLYPCPARAKHSGKDPTLWIPPRDNGDGFRLGLARAGQG